ncbi:dTDP-4-dehydrorhamnose 3,5-epimerase [soil metagenome]
MQIRELNVPDSYEITPRQFADERGVFLEWFRFDELEKVIGHRFDLRQSNTSVSRKGVLRGIHFADVPRGQAKYVTAVSGAVLDFVVDLRVGSPTFGTWDSVLLDTVDRRAVYIAEGLGHAFVALTDEATVTYLVSDTYNPSVEHAIDPRDAQVALEFPADLGELVISAKDLEAPSLADALASGLLPHFGAVSAYYRELNEEARA